MGWLMLGFGLIVLYSLLIACQLCHASLTDSPLLLLALVQGGFQESIFKKLIFLGMSL